MAKRGMADGNSLPTLVNAPNATFSNRMSFANADRLERGFNGSSVRLLLFVSAHCVWGTQ